MTTYGNSIETCALPQLAFLYLTSSYSSCISAYAISNSSKATALNAIHSATSLEAHILLLPDNMSVMSRGAQQARVDFAPPRSTTPNYTPNLKMLHYAHFIVFCEWLGASLCIDN